MSKKKSRAYLSDEKKKKQLTLYNSRFRPGRWHRTPHLSLLKPSRTAAAAALCTFFFFLFYSRFFFIIIMIIHTARTHEKPHIITRSSRHRRRRCTDKQESKASRSADRHATELAPTQERPRTILHPRACTGSHTCT